jgi:tetratricopeptide (TPR) repeat protein
MSPRIRVLAKSILPLLGACLVAAAGLAPTPALAQSGDAPQQAAPTADAPEPESAPTEEETAEETSRRARKQEAKERRIQEYLRKREERRARKEADRSSRETEQVETQAREIEQRQLAAEEEAARKALQAGVAQPESVAVTTPQPSKKRRKAGAERSRLPRGLARAQSNVRATELALDPTVQEYLTLIDEQGASPHQLAAFGSFVAQNGMTRDALEYYDVALRLASDDPVLWINVGILQMQTKNLSAAVSSFSRALSINPNSAVAHYNIGAALDEMNKYEEAVASYKTALSLDPSLGDPSQNPQAANNDLLLAVKLMIYQDQAGSLSHPLLDVPTGAAPTTIDE